MSTTVRDIGELLPVAQTACRLFLEKCQEAGLDVFVTETYRSQARQNELYEQGAHQTGANRDLDEKQPPYQPTGLGHCGEPAKKLVRHSHPRGGGGRSRRAGDYLGREVEHAGQAPF